jgi:hypothetical protein
MTNTKTIVKHILESKEESQRIATLLGEQDDDFAWILGNLEDLKKRFPNEYIAVHRRKVIESDQKFANLVEKLRKENIEINDVIVEYITAKPIKFLL